MFEVLDVSVVKVNCVFLSFKDRLVWCAVVLAHNIQDSTVIITFADYTDIFVVARGWNNRCIVLTPSSKHDTCLTEIHVCIS